MGKIYLRTKDAIAISGSSDYIPQHTYLVAEFDQKQYILRAGPSGSLPFVEGGNPFIGDLKFIGAENLIEFSPLNSASMHHDWDFDNNHKSFEIFSGTDFAVKQKFNEMRQIATSINQQNFDYSWYDQNCNTALSYVLKNSNIYINLNNLYDKNSNLLNILGSDNILIYDQLKTPKEKLDFFINYINDNLVDKILINEEYRIEKDNFIKILAQNDNILSDASYVDQFGISLDYQETFYNINNEKGDNLILIRNNAYLLENNNKISINNIINSFEKSLDYTYNFLYNNLKSLINQFSNPENFSQILSSVYNDFKNNKSINEIAENVAILTAIKSAFTNYQNQILFNQDDYIKILNNDYNLSSQGLTTLNFLKESSLYKISFNASLSFVSQLALNGRNFNQQDYLKLGIESISQASSQVAIENIFRDDFFQNIPYANAFTNGASAGASRIITALVNDTFADNKMNSHQWQSTLVSAGVVACFATVGSLIQTAMIAGAATGGIGAAIGVVIATLLIGGKSLEPNEYFEKIENFIKEYELNGVDAKIYAIDKKGTMLIASNYYNDKLFGNEGDDNLIGGNGTNQIYGYNGNDYILAKNDNDVIYGGDGADEIIAGSGDDFIVGGNGYDIIYGGYGNDEIYGSEITILNGLINIENTENINSEQIEGGEGNDIIYGGFGNDLIFGGKGEDAIYVDKGDDLVFAGSGANLAYLGDGNDIFFGGNDGDLIYSENDDDEIFCGNGEDVVYGGAGNDIIDGNSGRDLIFGSFGNDIIYAGDENVFFQERLFYEYQNSIHGEFGDDYLIGSNMIDIISDGYGDDVIYGGKGNDKIYLGSGNNMIFFDKNDGNDSIDIDDKNNISHDYLGENIIILNNYFFNNNINDLIKINKKNNNIEITLNYNESNINNITIENQYLINNKTLISSIQLSDKFQIDLKNLEFDKNNQAIINPIYKVDENKDLKYDYLKSYLDQLNIKKDINKINFFKNNSNAIVFSNNSGEINDISNELLNDVQWIQIHKNRNIFGGSYSVYKMFMDCILYAPSENSRVVGNYWDEFIFGNQYNNQLSGSSGEDYLDGFEGDDIIYGGYDNDIINGGQGNDLILGGSGSDRIYDNAGNDEIYANEGNDLIDDFFGQNLIFAGEGDDKININDSNNLIYGGSGNDIIRVETKEQSIFYNYFLPTYNNIIYGDEGNDNIYGGNKIDYLFGQIGADFIEGNGEDDYISGGAGNDILYGNDGNDKIFGDLGNDYLYGGKGNDYIWSGYGNDIIYGDEGDDILKSSFGDDLIYDGVGDDIIYGEDGDDLIYLESGRNYAYGGGGNDEIYINFGNNHIFGQDGNDVIYDNFGDNIISLGKDNDLIFFQYSSNLNEQIDIITDFNKDEDEIIIKTKINSQITFGQIISTAIQNGKDLELKINNNKLLLKNCLINDLNINNFKIGYTIDESQEILFGEYGENILIGNSKNNIIYGSSANDELFGGYGYDYLYGLEGDDIFHYEIDDRFIKKEELIFSDEIAHYYYKDPYSFKLIPTEVLYEFIYKPKNYINNLVNTNNFDYFINKEELIMNNKISQNYISIESSKSKLEPFPYEGIRQLISVEKVNYLYSKISSFATINFYNNQIIDINSYNRSYDNFDGGSGYNIIIMTNGNDFMSFSDNNISSISRMKSIEAIFCQKGDDIINLSSSKFSSNDLLIRGGLGNDKLFIGNGNDNIFGDEGNDEIFGGGGNDIINGGLGNDLIYAGNGNDIIDAILDSDQIYSESGNDLIMAGSKTLLINGGIGNDSINLNNINNSLKIDLKNNKITSIGSNEIFINIENIENILATNQNDEIYGNNFDNEIQGSFGDDLLIGGYGNDTYLFSNNSETDVIIEENDNATDKIKFLYNLDPKNLILHKNIFDLEILNADFNQKIIIKNQYYDNSKIEFLEFLSGDIKKIKNIIINNEDSNLEINKELIEKILNDKNIIKNISLRANNGNIIWDNLLGLFIYMPIENFNGFDEISILKDGEIINTISIYNNSINDAPTGLIDNFSFKVNEKININFNDYFKDNDNDPLSFELYLNDFQELPSWINFDNKSGKLSTEIPRSGSLDLKIKITDNNGENISQDFFINISRDIKNDVAKILDKIEINGDENDNKLYAIINSNDALIAGNGNDEIYYEQDEIWKKDSEINFKAWNIYSGDEFEIEYKIKNNDCFDGGDGYDIINLTNKDDALFLDDQNLSVFGNIAKFSNIEEIQGFDGDDVIDMTSFNFKYGNIKIYGGNGNDILWSNNGNDIIYGDNGNDNLQGGMGNDNLIGGNGSDIIKGFEGNDILNGGYGSDILESGYGNDIFEYSDFNESSLNNQDIIIDFNQLFDKISLKSLNYKNIEYKEMSDQKEADATSNHNLYYFHDKNLNTIIYDNNEDLSIMLKGEIYLNNDNFIFS